MPALTAKGRIQKGKDYGNCRACGTAVKNWRMKYCQTPECQKAKAKNIRDRFREKHGKEYLQKRAEKWRRKRGDMPKGQSAGEELAYKKLREYLGEEIEIRRRCWNVIRSPLTGHKLELDIYIPSLNLAVEVDGATHRTECYGKERLEYQQKNDLAKEEACLALGINLVRVPFGRDIKSFCEMAILDKKYFDSLRSKLK